MQTLLNTADAVAALTCEALQTATLPFDEKFNEQGRPHKVWTLDDHIILTSVIIYDILYVRIFRLLMRLMHTYI